MSRPATRLRRLSSLLPALAALVWLLLRSGRRPTRLAYPCQQAALGTSTILLGVPLAHALIRLMHHAPFARRHPNALGVLAAAVALALVVGPVDQVPLARVELRSPPADYTATLFVVDSAGAPTPTRHPGVDALIRCMDAGEVDFYRSPSTDFATGPGGIVGANDVVLIKINQQWAERGGTNTDVLRGLIRVILEHPDGFTGEVVVFENTQNYGRMDWPNSNAEDPAQSATRVIQDIAGEGWPVAAFPLDPIRTTSVGEYAEGDMSDGYVVDPVMNIDTQTRVSYPKFRTPGGAYVSLRHGVFDPTTETYDDERLTFINVPVLKCHGIYGVTASVKNHMGTMTTGLSTNAHAGVGFGGLGSFLATVHMPDLNVLDCIYVLARPGSGPSCSYGQATFVNKLVAGVDPVALDTWAVAHVLVPAIIANGFDGYPAQDPLNPASTFRRYLDRSMNELLRAGISVTNDLDAVTAECAGGAVPPTVEPARPRVCRAVPNPFRSATTLIATESRNDASAVEVYDATGRRVRRLDTLSPAGDAMTASWDGRDDTGLHVAPGRYYYRFVDRGNSRDVAAGAVTLLR